MKELVTLQFGEYSNFIGAHFWNFQEEYLNTLNEHGIQNPEINLNMYYRFGESKTGKETYTPRVLIFDTTENFGNIRRTALQYNKMISSYDEVHQMTNQYLWNGNMESMNEQQHSYIKSQPKLSKYQELLLDQVDVISEQEEKSSQSSSSKKRYTKQEILQDLDQQTTSWSEFFKPFLSEKSINPIFALQPHFEEKDQMDVYTIGKRILKDNKQFDKIEENLRYFMEECDSVQGFQIFTDTNDYWSCFTSDMLHYIHDDFGSKYSIITFGNSPFVEQFPTPLHQTRAILNNCLSFVDLYHSSNLFIPLSAQMLQQNSFSHLQLQVNNKYQTSAILAAAIETATLPYRLSNSSLMMELSGMQSILNIASAFKVQTLNTCIPFPISKHDNWYQYLSSLGPSHELPWMVPLSPMTSTTKDSERPYAQVTTVRGLATVPLRAAVQEQKQKSGYTVQEVMQMILQQSGSKQVSTNARDSKENRALSQCNSHAEMFHEYLNQWNSVNSLDRFVKQSLFIHESFPYQLFKKNHLLEDGFLQTSGTTTTTLQQEVVSIPMMSQIQTTKQSTKYMEHLAKFLTENTKFTLPTHYEVTRDDYAEYKETILKCIDDYED